MPSRYFYTIRDFYIQFWLPFNQYLLLTDMIKKVTDNLTARYGNVRKELDEIMGGKVLEYKGERIFNEGGLYELIGLVYENTAE